MVSKSERQRRLFFQQQFADSQKELDQAKKENHSEGLQKAQEEIE
jgi:hypothetical protein